MFSFMGSFADGVKRIFHGGGLVGEGLEVLKEAANICNPDIMESDQIESECETLMKGILRNMTQICTSMSVSCKDIVGGVGLIRSGEVHDGLDKVGDGMIAISTDIKRLVKYAYEMKGPMTKSLFGLNTIAAGIDEIGQALENMLYFLESTRDTGIKLRVFATFLMKLIAQLRTVKDDEIRFYILKFAGACEWIGLQLKKICSMMARVKDGLKPIVNFFAKIFHTCSEKAQWMFEKVGSFCSTTLDWLTEAVSSLLMRLGDTSCAEKLKWCFSLINDVLTHLKDKCLRMLHWGYDLLQCAFENQLKWNDQMLSDIWSKMKDVGKTLYDRGSALVGSAWGTVKSGCSTMMNWVWGKIKCVAKVVQTTVSHGVASIKEMFTNLMAAEWPTIEVKWKEQKSEIEKEIDAEYHCRCCRYNGSVIGGLNLAFGRWRRGRRWWDDG